MVLQKRGFNIKYFLYGKLELDHLKSVDLKLKRYIEKIGEIKRKINTDLFSALVESIISQQISTKAATTVTKRLKTLTGELRPENILEHPKEEIQKCGLSFKKVNYIQKVAKAFINNDLNYEELQTLPDEEIIKKLIQLPGVGRWTAEMLLIHTFLRPNVLSYYDLGIKRGLMILHNLEELSKEQFNFYKKLYSPYGTTASLYLWEIYHQAYS